MLTFEEYQALDREGNKGELSPSKEANVEAPAVQPDEEVYYWREEYDAKRKVIKVQPQVHRLSSILSCPRC